jgi:23S rRNA pseudouridine1911/1915/1917 synthase
VKSYLKHRQVWVNGQPQTKHDYYLKPGQTIEVKSGLVIDKPKPEKLHIIYEDEYLIVIEKEAGILSVGTGKEKEKTVYDELMKYVKAEDRNNKIFVVHRLDRETSGLMLFAKSEEVKNYYQENWHQVTKKRNYLALVEGKVKNKNGSITNWLKENNAFVVFSSEKPNGGQRSTTHYQTLSSNEGYSVLELALETGRKNQIRVHMQDIGHPIAGDKKYGAKTNPHNRMCLHAWKLSFYHPELEKVLQFETEIPKVFKKYLNIKQE